MKPTSQRSIIDLIRSKLPLCLGGVGPGRAALERTLARTATRRRATNPRIR